MEFSASQIAEIINGKVEGNPDTKIHYVSKIEENDYIELSLSIKTKFLNSSNYNALGSKQEKLIDLIEKAERKFDSFSSATNPYSPNFSAIKSPVYP